ncbi:MAG: YeiH family protein [Nocardioidaceae bacterium]
MAYDEIAQTEPAQTEPAQTEPAQTEPAQTSQEPGRSARTSVGQALRSAGLGLGPGLGLVAAGVAVAVVLARLVPAVSALTWAVLLGIIANNTGLHFARARAGTKVATRKLLRIGVVVLGFQLAAGEVLGLGGGVLAVVVGCVLVTFFGTRWIGRWMGVSPGTSLMVATGFSICGASAIAAMDAVSDSEEEDVATGIALVTVCGSLAIVALPWLNSFLGLSAREYGVWAGSSVHEVAQVVAAASAVPGALAIAVVVKLTRVVLLAPMVALTSVARRRTAGVDVSGRRPPLVPLFVLGFLAAVAVRSTGVLPSGVLDGLHQLDTVLLAAALFGLGCGVHLPTLRATGVRPLLLGFGSWALVGALSYGGVLLVA